MSDNAFESTNFALPPETSPASSIDLKSLLGIVLARRKLIAAMLGLALLATYGVLKLVPKVYKSTVEVLIFDPEGEIDQEVQKTVSPFVSPFRENLDNAAMTTEIEVIKSKALALRVAKELGLDKDPEFQPSHGLLSTWLKRLGLRASGGPTLGVGPEGAKVLRLGTAAEVLRRHLDAERVDFSYILAISATSEDPAKAQHLAATTADDYLASQREARQDALQRVADWLKSRLDDLQSRVLESEASIERLKTTAGLNDTDGKADVADQQISDLNGQLMAARGDVAEKRAQLEQAKQVLQSDGDLQEIPQVFASTAIGQLRLQASQLTAREAGLRAQLGPNHAEVIAIHNEVQGINKAITDEAARILGNLKNAYDTAVQREQSLEASLQHLTKKRGNSAEAKLRQLRRLADTDRKLYESYLSQFNEVSTRRTLQDAEARIITPADLPTAPSSPRRVLYYGFGGVFGLGLGLLLTFVLEFLRPGVKTGAEVERVFGYPVVGVIPLVRPRRRRRDLGPTSLLQIIADVPLSRFGEAVRTMRLSLQYSNLERVPKVILVTSSIPGEGKSAAAMLLAGSGATSGQRSVLVDCDVRRRSLSRAFGAPKRGLVDLLRGEAEIAEVTIQDPTTGTYVIPAGSVAQNASNSPASQHMYDLVAANLLTSQRMADLIAQLRARYDYVVLDGSPVLPVVDALALATMVDKVLMVVEWSRTPRESISEAFKVLRPEGHRIAGIVLNKVDHRRLHGYYRGYDYAYPQQSP